MTLFTLSWFQNHHRQTDLGHVDKHEALLHETISKAQTREKAPKVKLVGITIAQ